jgi:hypothetical protein
LIMPVRWCRFPFCGKGLGPGKPGEGEHGQGDVGVPGGGDHADDVGDDEAGERPPVVGYAVQLAYRGRHPRGDSHRLERHQRHRDQQTDRGQAQGPAKHPRRGSRTLRTQLFRCRSRPRPEAGFLWPRQQCARSGAAGRRTQPGILRRRPAVLTRWACVGLGGDIVARSGQQPPGRSRSSGARRAQLGGRVAIRAATSARVEVQAEVV